MALFALPQSSAVKIVDPNTQEDPLRHNQPTRKDSVQRQCRNIVIYGHCKFQDKGCIYYHPPAPETQPPRADSPATALTPQAVNAPVFVPKAGGIALPSTSPPPTASPPPQHAEYNQNYQPLDNSYDNYSGYQSGDIGAEGLSEQMEELESQYYDESFGQYSVDYDHGGVDGTYYGHAPVFIRQPLNYHLYTPSIPPEFLSNDTDTHFVPNSSDLRERLQSQSETIRGIAPLGLNLPEELQGYHTLVPLEPTATDAERRKIGNWYSTVYRAIRTSDGIPYALRRVENYRLMHQAGFAPIEAWSRIRHPAIIPIREAFTTRSFDDNSLVVSYAYYPNAKTLYEAHLTVTKPVAFQLHSRSQLQMIPQRIDERTLWTYIVQIASAIKKVHDSRLAVRMIDATKILLTGKNRVRLSCAGLMDILFYDSPSDMLVLQQEDLTMFGRLIFALCCGNPAASSSSHFQKSIDLISKAYSPDVKSAAIYLISKPGPHRSIDHLMDMIRGQVLAEHDEALMATDILENELRSELENARLVRLLCKLGFINERPEFGLDPRWSETGDRYIIKLFRDYVFHQVDEHGNPVVNLTHVLTCLNKLDAGTDERIMLVARDSQSCLVVSYKDIKACIEGAFSELAVKPKASSALLQSYHR